MTAEGLKAGDNLKKMEELYGTDYIVYSGFESFTVYEYAKDGCYLQIYFDTEDKLLYGWGLSVYKYDYEG